MFVKRAIDVKLTGIYPKQDHSTKSLVTEVNNTFSFKTVIHVQRTNTKQRRATPLMRLPDGQRLYSYAD